MKKNFMTIMLLCLMFGKSNGGGCVSCFQLRHQNSEIELTLPLRLVRRHTAPSLADERVNTYVVVDFEADPVTVTSYVQPASYREPITEHRQQVHVFFEQEQTKRYAACLNLIEKYKTGSSKS